MDRSPDPLIGSAAADVAGHPVIDVGDSMISRSASAFDDCFDAARAPLSFGRRLNFSTLVARRASWDRPLMTLYTRRQILVLLLLLAVAGLGLAVGHWRRSRPDLADYLEQLDRASPPSSSPAPPSGSGAPAEPSSSEPEPRRARRAKAPRSSSSPRGSPTDATSSAIDLNRATAVELTDLPGIGPALARRIVDARDTAGRFARVDELGRVRGMSARKIEQLRAFVTIAE